jgi:hypothetical protein
MKKVTIVLTSCGRPDLLEKTISSFIEFNTYSITKFIIVEDGPAVLSVAALYNLPYPSQMISTGDYVGQIAAIDYAYSLVETEYIFHLEDDWEFYRPHFIEKSLVILEKEAHCLQVWLRALDDTNGHPVNPRVSRTGDLFCRRVPWRRMEYDYCGVWHGFSFNPGLRRLKDYIEVKGYGIHLREYGLNYKGAGEEAMSIIYREKQKFATILADESGIGYVRHIGGGRTVEGATS